MQHYTIGEGADAVGRTVGSLHELGEDVWINLLVREQRLVPLHGDVELRSGDELVVQVPEDRKESLQRLFG